MDFAQLYSDAPLTPQELLSVTALIEWLDAKQGKHKQATYCRLTTEFAVEDVTLIKRRDFDRAIKFLVDLPEQKLN
jgi:hypothetical protein